MSTLLYAARTNSRSGSTGAFAATDTGATGLSHFVDTAAALVPAEILSLHALALGYATATGEKDGQSITTITDQKLLFCAFWSLLVLSIVLYVLPRAMANKWARLDIARMLIPAAAFICWTMIQRTTAFDAVCRGLTEGARTMIALGAVVVLGVIAQGLSYKLP